MMAIFHVFTAMPIVLLVAQSRLYTFQTQYFYIAQAAVTTIKQSSSAASLAVQGPRASLSKYLARQVYPRIASDNGPWDCSVLNHCCRESESAEAGKIIGQLNHSSSGGLFGVLVRVRFLDYDKGTDDERKNDTRNKMQKERVRLIW